MYPLRLLDTAGDDAESMTGMVREMYLASAWAWEGR